MAYKRFLRHPPLNLTLKSHKPHVSEGLVLASFLPSFLPSFFPFAWLESHESQKPNATESRSHESRESRQSHESQKPHKIQKPRKPRKPKAIQKPRKPKATKTKSHRSQEPRKTKNILKRNQTKTKLDGPPKKNDAFNNYASAQLKPTTAEICLQCWAGVSTLAVDTAMGPLPGNSVPPMNQGAVCYTSLSQ